MTPHETPEQPGPHTLGAAIKQRRAELGWSQTRLAEAIGATMQQSDVSALERARVKLPRKPRLERIAAALRLPLGELLARSGWADADRYFRDAHPTEAGPTDDATERLIVLLRGADLDGVRAAGLEAMLREWQTDDGG